MSDLLSSLEARLVAVEDLTRVVLKRYAAGKNELGPVLFHLEDATRALKRAVQAQKEDARSSGDPASSTEG